MPNALIFSSSFDGHRQVYVFVIADILNKLGYKLFIAGNFSANLNNTFYINKLNNNNAIIKINTCSYDGFGMGINNSELYNLQVKYKIDLTVFAEADNHIPLFISQLFPKKKRFHGRVIGIFLRPWHFYRNLDFVSRVRYIRGLRTRWKTDNRLFHEFLNKTFRLLSSTLCIDEFYVSKHRKIFWLPDVFQQYADNILLAETYDQKIWIERLNKFKQSNKDSFILFYFGAGQQRRGYDKLLKLAVDQGACFVHCGLRNDDEKYSYDVEELRIILKKDNKFFETNQYITDPLCIEYFFKAASHIVLPYFDFLGSSGVMLQALGYGIPVLVPDVGIIGYRTRKFNLGLTYDSDTFEIQFLRFKEIPQENYRESIDAYMKFQNSEHLENVLRNTFLGVRTNYIHP